MKSTYLYLKQHNKTGLKYSSSTVNNSETYKRSAIFWSQRSEVPGNDVTTDLIRLFTNKHQNNVRGKHCV